MSGAVSMTVTWDDAPVRDAIERLREFDDSRAHAMWDAIGEAMVSSTDMRFQFSQADADGNPWKPSERFLHDGAPPTLTEHGYLHRTLTHNVLDGDDGVEWGSALVYAAIHQAGGEIKREAHSQTLYRKAGRDGLSAHFTKRSKANFAQDVHVGAFDIVMPARPYLGISTEDEATIETIATRHLNAALLGVSPESL
jgi:phage gpG-like protein